MTDIDPERVRAIEALVTEWQHEHDVPGVSVVIVDAERERYAEGFGARDLESNAPATPDTLYGMGSITKPVTALAIAQLVDADELSYDDPVDRHVDHLADAPGDPITVAALLTHTSGMPANEPGFLSQAFEGRPAGVADEADRRRFHRDAAETRATDRTRFMYYNAGYEILGAVVEAVDGRPYAQYVQEEVFDPLAMPRSTFRRQPVEADDDAMTGYRPGGDDEPPEPTPFPFEPFIRPSGGLVSSVRELSRFLRAMMTDGSFDGARVCPPETVDHLQHPRTVRQPFVDGTTEEYGYGWMRQPLVDDEVVGHGGSIVVSTAYAGFLVDEGIGVVAACNTTTDPHVAEVALAALAVATGRDRTAVPAFALAEKVDAVAGNYASFRDAVTATVEPNEGGLSVSLTTDWGDEEITAFPETLDPDDHAFYTVTTDGARLPIEFDVGGNRVDLYLRRQRLRRTGPTD